MKVTDFIRIQLKTKITDKFELGTSVLGGEDLSSDVYVNDPDNYYWQDVTPKVLSISTKRGVDNYTGATAIPVVGPGIMHIRTTNHLLDPKYYSFLKPRQEVRLINIEDETHPVIFQGKIDNIQVDYRSDNEYPLIAFDVVDPIGLLQQASIQLTSLAYSANRNWNHRVTEILTNANKLDIIGKDKIDLSVVGGGDIKHGYWEQNRTALEALQLAQLTEGGFVYFDKNNVMNAYGKGSVPASQAVSLEFSNTDFTKMGYKNIVLDYNSESIVNEIQVSNEWGYTKQEWNEDADAGLGAFEPVIFIENKAQGPYRDEASINRYGTRSFSVDTNFDLGAGDTQLKAWADDILANNITPQTIVREIEWDGKKNAAKATSIEILDSIHIQHTNKKLEPELEIINTDYQIIGIQHELQADSDTWRVKYILFEHGRFV